MTQTKIILNRIRTASLLGLVCLLASCGGDGTDQASMPVTAQAPGIPLAPVALIAVARDRNAVLEWEASLGATGYTVYRSTSASGPYAEVAANVVGTIYTDVPLTNGIRYFYIVRANNAAGVSENSNHVRATPVSPPAAGSVRWPLSGSVVANADGVRFQYGARRINNYDFHAGIDIPAPSGTPIYPLMNGTVTARVNNWIPADGDGAGNYVLVSHGQEKWTVYMHMSTVSASIGDVVVAGVTELGKVGTSGANSNHLHLAYMVGLISEATSEARSKNPLEILPHLQVPDTAPYLPAAVFRTDGSNTVDISMPAHRMTMRWAILKGGGQTRILDYYEIVSQGAVRRNDQNQPASPGLHINASSPPLPDPAVNQNFILSLRPNPVNDFVVDRVILKDFNGRVILDASKP